MTQRSRELVGGFEPLICVEYIPSVVDVAICSQLYSHLSLYAIVSSFSRHLSVYLYPFLFFFSLLIPHTFCAIFHYPFIHTILTLLMVTQKKRPATAITFFTLLHFTFFYIISLHPLPMIIHLPSGWDYIFLLTELTPPLRFS